MSARNNIELLYRTSQTSFLLSNNSLCLLVSEESIFFKFQPIRNKNCTCRPCFYQIRMKWGNHIDASCKISVHLAKWFQRRRFKCDKLSDRRRMPSNDKYSHGFRTGEIKSHFFSVSIYFPINCFNCFGEKDNYCLQVFAWINQEWKMHILPFAMGPRELIWRGRGHYGTLGIIRNP